MPQVVTCLNCGHLFHAYPSDIANGRRYCSLKCRSAHRFGREIPESKTPVEFPCKNCGKSFTMMKSYVTAYRKKFDHDPWYCSMECSATGRKAANAERQTFTCEQCGQTVARKRYAATGRVKYYSQQRFCSPKCKADAQRAAFHKRFAEGNFTRRVKRGYVMISIPTAPGEPRREMLEHRYIMEQFLGRELLPTETVHHKRAWDKTTNTMENLELRTGNHGPGGTVEDLVPWCAEMLETYPMFITPEIRERLKVVIERSN